MKGWICRIIGHKDAPVRHQRPGDRFVECLRCGREKNLARDYSRSPAEIPGVTPKGPNPKSGIYLRDE